MTDDVITPYLTDEFITPPCGRPECPNQHGGQLTWVSTGELSFIKVVKMIIVIWN